MLALKLSPSILIALSLVFCGPKAILHYMIFLFISKLSYLEMAIGP